MDYYHGIVNEYLRTARLFLFLLCFPLLAHAQADCPWNATSCHVQYTDTGTTTSYTLPRETHTDAVIAAEVGTAAALIYFFEIRPELQRLHNERINAIEGEFQNEYDELNELIAVPAPDAQGVPPDPTVHGYRLGESWIDFVAASPRLKANTNACARRPIPKQTRKHQVYDPCAAVRYMSHSGAGKITMSCRNSEEAKDMMCRDFDGEVTFLDSKLAALKIVLPGISLEDAELKFGPPSGTDRDKSSDVWHSSGYSVAADHLDNGIALILEKPILYANALRANERFAESATEKKPDATDGSPKIRPATAPLANLVPASVASATVTGTAPAPALEKTIVQITSDPDIGADIEVDGNFVGQTPSRIELANGDHTLRLTLNGFAPWGKKLHTAGGTVTIDAQMNVPTVYRVQ